MRALSNDETLGAYAVRGSGGALWLLLVNRDVSPLETEVSVASPLNPGSAQVYRFDGSSPLGLAGTVPVATDGFDIELPGRSVSLVVTSLSTSVVFADGFETGDVTAWTLAVP